MDDLDCRTRSTGLRAFVVSLGIAEDPITGSLNAGIASWLIPAGLAKLSYLVSQGSVLGGAGRAFIDQDAGDIWIGGDVTACIKAHVLGNVPSQRCWFVRTHMITLEALLN